MRSFSKIIFVGLLSSVLLIPSTKLSAQSSGLTLGQIESIVSLVRSFGASEAVVQNVSSALSGTMPSTSTSTSTPTSSSTFAPTGVPIIEMISPSFGPVGTYVDLVGADFLGIEGDLSAVIVNEQGEKGILYSGGSYYPSLYKTIYPGKELIRIRIPDKVCTVNTFYNGDMCPAYMNITPGAYKLSTSPWETKSNQMNFTVTAEATSITVLSPNGGEVFAEGVPNRISWNGGSGKVQIGLINGKYETDRTVLGWISLNEKPNGSLVWNGASVSDLTGTVLSPVKSLSSGPYRIIAVSAGLGGTFCIQQNGSCNYDIGNASFTFALPLPAGFPSVGCSTNVGTAKTGEVVTWEATALGGTQPYTFKWGGTDEIFALPSRTFSSSSPFSGKSFLDVRYNVPGVKITSIGIYDANMNAAAALCSPSIEVTQAPSPVTLLFPNEAETFAMTSSFDATQALRVRWAVKDPQKITGKKVWIALLDEQGRECEVGGVVGKTSALVGLIDGYRCPNGGWQLSPGRYKIRVYREGEKTTAFDTSDSFFTLVPPISLAQSVTPSAPAVNSGESVKFKFVFPRTTSKAALYVFCPNGIRTSFPDACNHYNDVTLNMASSTEYAITLFNSGTKTQDITANYYIYLPNNPEYARSVSSRVSVRAVATTTPASITVLSPNGGETIRFGSSTPYRWSVNQAGSVDVTLVPYPAIDAGLVCQIVNGVSAAVGELALAISPTSSCIKGQTQIVPGNYKLFVTLRNEETTLATDSSNASFTVATSTP